MKEKMEKWNKLKQSEKVMVVIIIVCLVAIAISWKRVWMGMDNGLNHFFHYRAQ